MFIIELPYFQSEFVSELKNTDLKYVSKFIHIEFLH